MLKVIDVDCVADRILALTFNDGYQGEADLSPYFSAPPFSDVRAFEKFSLTADGALSWSGQELTAATLRTLTKGQYQSTTSHFNVQEMEVVIYGIKEQLNPIKAALLDVLQQSMTQALGLSEDKRAHRFIPFDKSEF